MENLEKRITVGQEKFDKLCANLCGKKNHTIKKLLCWKKNLTTQNVQTVIAVGPRKIPKINKAVGPGKKMLN